MTNLDPSKPANEYVIVSPSPASEELILEIVAVVTIRDS